MDRWDTGRIEAFSDGVFAIAITLLVLDIDVRRAEFDNLWRGFADEWPAYLGLRHELRHDRWDLDAPPRHLPPPALREQRRDALNLLLLMAVSFLPFPTRLVAEAIHDSNAERAAVIIYGASLLVISIALRRARPSDRPRPRRCSTRA